MFLLYLFVAYLLYVMTDSIYLSAYIWQIAYIYQQQKEG